MLIDQSTRDLVYIVDNECVVEEIFVMLIDQPTRYLAQIVYNKEYVVEGIGTVTIPLRTRNYTITKVFYVSGLTSNLLFINQILNHNLMVKF